MEHKEQLRKGREQFLWQLMKYSAVGVVNTIATAGVIYIALQLWGASPILSNVLGYSAGLVTSFLLNSRWTFGTGYSWRRLGIFLIAFLFCYGFQLTTLLFLERWDLFTPYHRQILAMGAYVVVNFILNKWVTFRPSRVV